jgi:hypothetical protein
MEPEVDVAEDRRGGALAVVVAALGLVALVGTCLGIVAEIPVAAGDVAWRAYEDPSKTVTMEVPRDWRPGKQAERGTARVVKFALPDAGGELALSISSDLRRPGELPASIVKPFFPEGASLSGPRTARGKGWLGLRQEATTTVGGKERVVVGQFYAFGTTLVAVTLADEGQRIDAYREDFERIVKSIQYHEPAIDTVRSTSPDGPRG